jgi:quercetin dioxygenase-like cupin family protein
MHLFLRRYFKTMIVKGGVKAVMVGPGNGRKVLAADGSLMAVEFSFEKGAVGALHQHPHEQIGYIVKGSFVFEQEGVKTTLQAGDSYYVKPNAAHGVVALEAGIIFDVFTPQREEFRS